MQSFLDEVKQRRSIRRFEARDIEQEKLEAILEAARWTPSWANTQCWEVIVIQDGEQKSELSQLLSPKNPATLAVADAPLTLAICAAAKKSGYYKGEQSTKFSDWFMYDCGLLSQTLCLTAHTLGLGSVIVGAFDHGKTRKLLELPKDFEVVALIPMGYPDHAPSAPKRRELAEFVHYNRFIQKAT